MSKPSESTKLLGSSPDTKNFYFLNRTNSKVEDKDNHGIEVVAPIGAPKMKIGRTSSPANRPTQPQSSSQPEIQGANDDIDNNSRSSSGFDWVYNLFGSRRTGYQPIAGLPRKVPVKIEPKVFFANERTFLAWLHMSVTLASISMAIIAFAEANALSKMYGLMLMPVAIAFCVYSLWMYTKRAGMIRRKEPGPYEDKFGPIALASLLAISIVINFLVKVYDIAT